MEGKVAYREFEEITTESEKKNIRLKWKYLIILLFIAVLTGVVTLVIAIINTSCIYCLAISLTIFIWGSIFFFGGIKCFILPNKKKSYYGEIIEKRMETHKTSDSMGDNISYKYFLIFNSGKELEVKEDIFKNSLRNHVVKISFICSNLVDFKIYSQTEKLITSNGLTYLEENQSQNDINQKIEQINSNEMEIYNQFYIRKLRKLVLLTILLLPIFYFFLAMIIGAIKTSGTYRSIRVEDFIYSPILYIFVLALTTLSLRGTYKSVKKISQDKNSKKKLIKTLFVVDFYDNDEIHIIITNDNKEYEIPDYVNYKPSVNDWLDISFGYKSNIILDITKTKKHETET